MQIALRNDKIVEKVFTRAKFNINKSGESGGVIRITLLFEPSNFNMVVLYLLKISFWNKLKLENSIEIALSQFQPQVGDDDVRD